MERERAEGERVAYVAATRARDLLVVPAPGDAPYPDGWIAPLNAAIYPREDARRIQTRAEGCPAFKSKDTVLTRPDGDPASMFTVCPGEHHMGPPGDEHSVVWWGPDELSLGAQTSFGLRRDDLIVRDVSPEILRQRLDTYQAWRAARETAIATARMPSVDVLTATEWAGYPTAPASGVGTEGPPPATLDGDVTIETAAEDGVRPGGARFGTLVHALLADVPLEPTGGDMIARLAEAHGRVLGAEAEEVAAAGDAVRRVLRHPLLLGAARATELGLCYRETPVTWRLETGAIVEGHVDLAYIAGEEVVVVDFKTDRELDGAIERYRRQVQIYTAAVGSALGRPARGVLLRV